MSFIIKKSIGLNETIPNGGYWIIKNDLGYDWGEDGYFRMGYDQCEIDSSFWFASWEPNTLDPVFALKVGTRYCKAGDRIELPVFARVPEGNTPSYLAVGLPAGASYDPNTGLFTWTPADDQTGVYEIDFIAFYGNYTTTQIGRLVIVPR